jgi:hypothetical protein
MRILTRRIYRAFPELDRYSDERCERFIKAARRGKWRLLAHIIVIGAAFVVSLALTVALFILIASSLERTAGRGQAIDWALVLPILAAIPLMSIPPLAAFLTRDRLLRRRVRYVLRTRGTCQACHYSLIGLPVDERFITCPECGMESEVDSSLGELVVDQTGQARYKPSAKSLARPPRIFTPARKKLLKRIGVVAAFLLGIGLSATWVAYELWLRKQADLALSERPGAQGLHDFTEKIQPPGIEPSANAWASFTRAQRIMENANSRVLASGGALNPAAGVQAVPPDFTLIFAPHDTTDPKQQADDAAAKATALTCLAAYAQDGVFDELKEMAARPRAIRDLNLNPVQPAVTLMLPELGQIRNLARINAARMKLAVDAHDLKEFADATEALFALARMERQQPFLLDGLVGAAVEALGYARVREILATHPDAQWLDAMDKAIARQSFVPDRATFFEGERLSILDTTGWVFSNPKMVRRGRFSPGLANMFGGQAQGRLGTYTENRDEINARFATLASLAGKDHWERPAGALNQSSELLMLNLLMPAMSKALESHDKLELDRRGYAVMSALEHYRLAHGEYPASLTALVPDQLKQLPLDPWSGKPLGYVKLKEKDAQGREYLLYSVGADGQDDGGKEAPGAARYGALSSDAGSRKGFDFVINEDTP